MARLPRIDIAGVPQHVIQRGNNRLPCFLDDDDRHCYLRCLHDALVRFGCDLHAYVLMTNHTHLLMTPRDVGALSRFMHTFSRNYVGMFNARHGRTGTLWEGRYKACLVDSERYSLACYRYIELNPVRARMVKDPAAYRWSSYLANALGQSNALLTPHSSYRALGSNAIACASAYHALCTQVLPEETLDEIRLYIRQQGALGTDEFRAQVEAKLQRFAGVRPAHRPRKLTEDEKCP